MKIFKTVVLACLLITLVSCSAKTKEPKIVGISKNTDIIAQLAFENRVYSIEGNMTPVEKIQDAVGRIKEVVKTVKENGQVKLYNSKINITPETKIYSIKNVDKNTVVAVKVGENYYTAILAYNLNLNKK